MSSSFIFLARLARRIPDPVFHDDLSIDRHIFFVPVRAVPKGLPLDPNARVPNLNRRVYRELRDSLLNVDVVPGTFHLKHKGITVVAKKVEKRENGEYLVTLSEGHGILDGGHTYELITSIGDDLPESQFVKFEILVNVPPAWIVPLAQGLNTSVQVQQFALDDLAGKFDWMKEELADQPYLKEIAWRQNEKGAYDARDLVSFLTMFNITAYPNAGDAHPVMAYASKAKTLEAFDRDENQYRHLRGILKDILLLHDEIQCTARQFWNESGGRFGKLDFVESKKRGEFTLHFNGQQTQYRLMNGALFPILGAFRWMVDTYPDGSGAHWRGGFDNVLSLWRDSAATLMKRTATANNELGRNPTALGKSTNLWASLHALIAKKDMEARMLTTG